MDLDSQVKMCVYRHFADTGEAPSTLDIAGRVGCSGAEVAEAFTRLRLKRVLLLEKDGSTIRMAPPFSGVPTAHRVESAGRWYFANCAWDAFGIPAALHRDAVVYSECGQSGEPFRLPVGSGGPESSDWLFHCLVPAARWWVDLVFT
jgi:hypothetical protein